MGAAYIATIVSRHKTQFTSHQIDTKQICYFHHFFSRNANASTGNALHTVHLRKNEEKNNNNDTFA